MKSYITNSAKETQNLAGKIARSFKGSIIALSGSLGAGKTTFTQGFAKGLGVKGRIISPTFVLIRSHHIPKSHKVFSHIDLYRLESEKDFAALGLKELLNDPNNIILIEWADKIKDLLPQNATWINFESENETHRKITISYN